MRGERFQPPKKMAAKLAEAMAHPTLRQSDLDVQATGRPLEWWFDAPAEKGATAKVRSFVAKQALAKMTALEPDLSDDDWQLLLTTARHLASGSGRKPGRRKVR